MVSGLVISQELSLAASQIEVDPAAKAQRASEYAQTSIAGAFIKLLEVSMESVNHLTEIEKEDPLRDDEEDLPKEE